jgi:hypothetical protein
MSLWNAAKAKVSVRHSLVINSDSYSLGRYNCGDYDLTGLDDFIMSPDAELDCPFSG